MTTDRSDPAALVVGLADAVSADPTRVGRKAANLARLASASFPVPPGIVVTPAAEDDWDSTLVALTAGLRALGEHRFAVRSSAVAEDLEDASFAGQYETELGVMAAEVPAAVRRVFASAASAQVEAYRRARAGAIPAGTSAIAVLVQVMVDAEAAGVAFTANPVSADRDEVVISAVRGLGERLVSGQAVADEWVVRARQAARRSGSEDAITAAQARAIAELARRVEREFGRPQDIEWAIEGGRLYLLQARPMTALGESVRWIPPSKGWWLRNLRLGEWLPEPVTPLFVDWLVPLMENGQVIAATEDMEVAPVPASAVINGWYYTTPQGRGSLVGLLGRLLRHPRALKRLYTLLIQPLRDPPKAVALLGAFAARWRDQRQPRYAAAVAAAEAKLDDAAPRELVASVDSIGTHAGVVLWSVESVAGSAWKIEGALARFVRRHLTEAFEGSYQELLIGLPGTEPEPAAHAVHSVDWFWPTSGEGASMGRDPDMRTRHRRLREQGDAAARRCREALAGDPRLLRRFDELLEIAQVYAVLREQQTRALTLGWPTLRRAVLRLGAIAVQADAIERPHDVFFLTRAEVTAVLDRTASHDLRGEVEDRRTRWERQRRLVAPLELGAPPAFARGLISGVVDSARREGRHRPGALIGHPASPGRATGPVRIISGPDQFDSFDRGAVLVARSTAPAWTPLFSRAAAVVTDGGSLAAHASLVAREFGIPAVVATGDATRRLHDGQVVVVDGNAGIVEDA